MCRYILILLAGLFTGLLISTIALGQTPTTTVAVIDPSSITPEGAFSFFAFFGKAFKHKEWTLVFAGLLTVVVALIRLIEAIDDKLPPGVIPWLTMATAMCTSMAIGLQQHMPLGPVIVTGLTVGVAAVGGWETFGKMARAAWQKVMGTKPPAPAEDKPPVLVPVPTPLPEPPVKESAP